MFYINKLKNSCNWNKNIPFYKQIEKITQFEFQKYLLVNAEKGEKGKKLYYIKRKYNTSWYNFNNNLFCPSPYPNANFYSDLFNCIEIIENLESKEQEIKIREKNSLEFKVD